MELLYQRATGWLGWSDEAALNTPLARLHLALEGQVDYLRKTNPWRTQEDIDREAAEEAAKHPPDQDTVRRQLMAWATGAIEQGFKGKGVRRGG